MEIPFDLPMSGRVPPVRIESQYPEGWAREDQKNGIYIVPKARYMLGEKGRRVDKEVSSRVSVIPNSHTIHRSAA